MGLHDAYRGAVRPEECDADGLMRADGVIARVWDGVPNLRNRGSGIGVAEEGIGSAAAGHHRGDREWKESWPHIRANRHARNDRMGFTEGS